MQVKNHKKPENNFKNLKKPAQTFARKHLIETSNNLIEIDNNLLENAKY